MSLRIFREHMTTLPDGKVDATNIISRACYEAFLAAKSAHECEAEAKKFYRVLSTHLSGTDGRKAFKKAEEEAILLVLRKNEHWPCFPAHIHLGSGFRGKGFHEKQQDTDGTPSSSTTMETRKKPRIAKPKPPAPQEAEENLVGMEFVSKLARNVMQFSMSFASFGVDVWKSVIGVVRFLVLAKTGTILGTIPTEYATNLMQAAAKENPEDCIIILELLRNGEFERRVLAQNSASINTFGEITQNHSRMLMQKEDLFRIVLAVGNAFNRPGVHFPVQQQVLCVDGILRPFQISYMCDPQSYLLVTSARSTM